MDNQEERLSLESVPIHRLPVGIGGEYEQLHFPIDHNQLRSLLGKVLTQIETMNLAPHAEKATKSIFTQMLWRWFDEAMDNAVTSAPDASGIPCIAPIKLKRCTCDGGTSRCSGCNVSEYIRLIQMPEQLEPGRLSAA